MLGKRKHWRVKCNAYVYWSIPNQSIQGEAKVTNTCVGGMDLMISNHFEPILGTIFIIQPDPTKTILLEPKKAKLAWWKQKTEGGINLIHCGFEFI